MLRALAAYLIASLAIASLAGGLYGAAVIGVAPFYAALLVASVPGFVGYVRWDTRRRH